MGSKDLVLFLLLLLPVVLGQTVVNPTTNPNDPTPASCIGDDPEDCECIVGGERFSTGETYRQLKDPRRGSDLNQVLFTANAVDMLFVVDESSSMADEHYWLRDMIGQLEDALRNIGIGNYSGTPNRYGLVGFGTWKGRGNYLPTVYPMPTGNLMGSAEELVEASQDLQTHGLVEDGYKAIQYALQRYKEEIEARQAARMVILITDEDLDNRSGIGYQSLLKQLMDAPLSSPQLSYKLNVVVNHRFRSGDVEALGVTSQGLAYVDNPRSINHYVIAFNGEAVPDSGFGNTLDSYVRLAWATGGAAWNLKKIYNGGFPVTAFTRSFIDVKVQEALTQLLQCVECVCSAQVSIGFNAVCNVTHVDRDYECVNDTGTVYCEYKNQVYNVGDEFRDFDILREGLARPELCVDVMFVVDESGSMVTEHKWLERLSVMIDKAFKDQRIGTNPEFPNQFGLIGFGSNIEGAEKGRVYNFQGNPPRWEMVEVAVPDNTDPFYDLIPNGDKNDTSYWGSAGQFSSIISKILFVDGQFEDGYSGIATALKYYHVRDNCAHHIVLVTDEDRDHLVQLDQNDLKSVLINRKFILTVAIDLTFLSGEGEEETKVLGCDRLDQGYVEVADSPFPYRVQQNCRVKPNSGGPTTEAEYYQLAISTGGSAWDLKKLREGGLAAAAFTSAFIEVGVQETVRAFKVCKLCRCNEDGTVSCEDKRKGGLEIDCLIPPDEVVSETPPTAPPNITEPPSFTDCTSPYNTSVNFKHGSALSPPPEVVLCVKRLTCNNGRVNIEIQDSCPPVSCNNSFFPPPPNCCPVCATPPPAPPTPGKDEIDFDALQSSGPGGRRVTVMPSNITMAMRKTLVLTYRLYKFKQSRTTVEWYKKRKRINPSEVLRLKITERRLTITDFQLGDSGTYTCVVREKNKVYGASVVVRLEDVDNVDESCLQFNGESSYVQLTDGVFSAQDPANQIDDLHLEFTSQKDSGVIYASHDDGCREFFLIFICNGNLKLVWNLGRNTGKISENITDLNTSHILRLTRFGPSVTYSLNGDSETKSTSSSHKTLEVTQQYLGRPSSACSQQLECPLRDMFFEGGIGNIHSIFNMDFNVNTFPGYNVGHCSLN